jgi:hypothetical protein
LKDALARGEVKYQCDWKFLRWRGRGGFAAEDRGKEESRKSEAEIVGLDWEGV